MITGKARLSRILDIQRLAAEGLTCKAISVQLGAPINSIWATAKAYEIPVKKASLFGDGKPMLPARLAAIQRIIGLGASDGDVSIATHCKAERVAQIRAEMQVAK